MSKLLLLLAGGLAPLLAQNQELGLTLGRLASADRPAIRLGSGTALQANYAYRLWGGEKAALFGEVHFLASPQRLVASSDPRATRDVATLYLTPGARLKFFPTGRVQPYVALGGGYALHEHSTLDIGGRPNAAPRTKSGSAFAYGGGVDVRLWRWLGARFEVRDFVASSPVYNVPVGGRQHNVVTSGGLVLRFGN